MVYTADQMADRLWARERPAGSRRSAKKRRNAKIHCAAGTLGSGCHSMLQCKMPAATQDSSKQQEVYSPVAVSEFSAASDISSTAGSCSAEEDSPAIAQPSLPLAATSKPVSLLTMALKAGSTSYYLPPSPAGCPAATSEAVFRARKEAHARLGLAVLPASASVEAPDSPRRPFYGLEHHFAGRREYIERTIRCDKASCAWEQISVCKSIDAVAAAFGDESGALQLHMQMDESEADDGLIRAHRPVSTCSASHSCGSAGTSTLDPVTAGLLRQLCQKVPVVGEAYRDAREGREGLLSHTDPPQLQLPPARLDTIGWVGFRTSLLRVAVHRAQLQRAAQAVHLADKKELRKRICELSQALEMTDLPATTSCCRSKSRLAPAYTNAGGLRWPA